MKRILAVFLMLAILLTGLTVTASAATTGWVQKDGVWYYYKADGTMVKSDWVQSGGKWYYLNADGGMVYDGIWEIKDKYYAFDKNGAMAIGWYSRKGVYDNGEAWTSWYYAGKDGALKSGWQKIDGKWYYFDGSWTDPETGKTYTYPPIMISGTVTQINKTYYAFKGSGEMIVGWGQPWISYSGTGDWKTTWVYANADGSLVKGWKKIDGKWYYFWEDWPEMVRDSIMVFVDGKPSYGLVDPDKAVLYAFKKSGAMAENEWYEDKWVWEDEEGKEHSESDWYYAGKDGALKKGWFQDKGKWYYLDAKWAWMYSDGMWTMSDGKTYGFKKNGEMVTGWYQFNDVWYYFKDSGKMAEKEWVKSGNSWYYLKDSGQMAKSETLTIDGKAYKFDANGAWIEK